MLDSTISPAGYIQNISGSMVLLGTGKDGGRHVLDIEFNMEISDFGTTVIAPFDTTNKTIIDQSNGFWGDRMDIMFDEITEQR